MLTELRDLARTHAPAAIRELARLAGKAKSEQARVAAIKELLDRGYGKPILQSSEHPVTAMTDASQRLEMIEIVFVSAEKPLPPDVDGDRDLVHRKVPIKPG